MKPFRVFVTGTDTGVGKTQVAAALLSLMADAGLNPAAMKPYESGVRNINFPDDAIALRKAARCNDELADICVHRFKLPVAPGVAAARARKKPDFKLTQAAFKKVRDRHLVVEGAGGLFVPLDEKREVIDLIEHWDLPVLLVARAGLGTLNHVALSLEALKARKINVLGVVLSKSSANRDPSERDNRSLIVKRHDIKVFGPVPFISDPDRRHRAFRKALRSLVPR